MMCLACVCTMNAGQAGVSQTFNVAQNSNATDVREVPLEIKPVDDSSKGVPIRKSPILIPEVTLDGHTLHFITPCTGLTLQLVQDDEVCYETVITSDYLEIPANITGMYELQILRGDYVFFAEVEL